MLLKIPYFPSYIFFSFTESISEIRHKIIEEIINAYFIHFVVSNVIPRTKNIIAIGISVILFCPLLILFFFKLYVIILIISKLFHFKQTVIILCWSELSARKREKSRSQKSFSSRQLSIPQISIVVRHSRKAKSPILSLENLRGIVRRAKPRNPANSVVTVKSKSRE